MVRHSTKSLCFDVLAGLVGRIRGYTSRVGVANCYLSTFYDIRPYGRGKLVWFQGEILCPLWSEW